MVFLCCACNINYLNTWGDSGEDKHLADAPALINTPAPFPKIV